MEFLVSPPEVNSLRVHAGVGSGSMVAAAAAWDELAANLQSAAASFGSVASGLSGRWWQGPSSTAMREAAAPYVAWLSEAATQAERAAAQARVTVGAFEAAFAATVHPAVVAANRAQLVSLAASNMFGQNASAIAAVEAEYEHMWDQDVAAMVGYHAAASAAGGQLMPWRQLPPTLPGQGSASFSGTRITVPGAAPGLVTGHETPQQYAARNAAIGQNWFPGTTPEVVKYPATVGLATGLIAPTANQSFAIGQQALNTDILNATAGKSVVVTGLSEGTIVIDREEAYLSTAPNASSPSQVTFVEFANPERGIADTYLHAGTTVPGIEYTVATPPVSQYNTALVYTQYEGVADPPDRPWHLLADVNALVGWHLFHGPTAFASPSQAVEVSSVTNSLGGSTTTYMIPTATLPILIPLQQMGVPSPIVGALNSLLTPIVNEGYSQFDPNGPYFGHGKLVW
jgi:PPE family/PE-PPE domain